MDEKPRRPEEFGVTGMMYYDDPAAAARYWQQFSPNEFIGVMVHDARNRLAQSVVTLQFLLDRADVGVISLDTQLGNTSIKEFLATNLTALNELWNVVETAAEYTKGTGTSSNQ
ncbi:MAG: hypothetical protein R3E39_24080 [Anaerolineae bacterium]